MLAQAAPSKGGAAPCHPAHALPVDIERHATAQSFRIVSPVLLADRGLTGSVQRDLHLAGKSEYVRLDFSDVGRERYTPVCSPCIAPFGPVNYSDVIHMLNFKSGIQWNENVRFAIYAENLLNDRGYLSPFAVEGNSNRAKPRTYGFELDARFE
jgi:hypothetical protein